MDATAPLDIAIATCESHPGFCAGDDQALVEQLEEVGVTATPAVWNNPRIRWGAFDAILIRTTWDYTEHLAEFIAWMHRANQEAPVLNPPSLAEGNLDKSYLKKLGDAAVPTLWLQQGSDVRQTDAVLDAAQANGWDQVVIKPAVGAGAEDLFIGKLSNHITLRAHASHIHRRCDAMLQPLIEGVRTRGELSIVLIDGKVTHAVRKKPKPNDYRVQIEFGGQYQLESPPPPALDAAAAAAVLWDEVPLYARVDLVEPEPGVFWIIEVELVEPELFFPMAPHAGAALGESLRARVGSTMRA